MNPARTIPRRKPNPVLLLANAELAVTKQAKAYYYAQLQARREDAGNKDFAKFDETNTQLMRVTGALIGVEEAIKRKLESMGYRKGDRA